MFEGRAGGGEVALFADDAEFAGDGGAGPVHAAGDLLYGEVGVGEVGFEFVAAGRGAGPGQRFVLAEGGEGSGAFDFAAEEQAAGEVGDEETPGLADGLGGTGEAEEVVATLAGQTEVWFRGVVPAGVGELDVVERCEVWGAEREIDGVDFALAFGAEPDPVHEAHASALDAEDGFATEGLLEPVREAIGKLLPIGG